MNGSDQMELTLSEKLEREIRILGIVEDEDEAWCAIALELGLRGYGETFEVAVEDLNSAIRAQVRFNAANGTLDAENIFFPAEDRYLELFEGAGNGSRRELKRSRVLVHLVEESLHSSPSDAFARVP